MTFVERRRIRGKEYIITKKKEPTEEQLENRRVILSNELPLLKTLRKRCNCSKDTCGYIRLYIFFACLTILAMSFTLFVLQLNK